MQIKKLKNDSVINESSDYDHSLLPLLSAQKGIWVAQQFDLNNPRYNCGGYIEIDGQLDIAVFKKAVQIAISDTEALRVRFIVKNDLVYQKIEDLHDDFLKIIDISNKNNSAQIANAWMWNDIEQPVDLRKIPLINQVLFKISPTRFLFYLRYHHILMDGFGQMLYWRRVSEIYSSLVNNQKYANSPFRTLNEIINDEVAYRSSKEFKSDRNFWLNCFDDKIVPTRLSNRTFITSRKLLRKNAALTIPALGNLIKIARLSQTRWSSVIIAAIAAYIQRMTMKNEVVLTLPLTSRITTASQITPCMVANELPLRLCVDTNKDFIHLVQYVSKQVAQVFSHQCYRGEELNQELLVSGSNHRQWGPVVNIINFDHKIHFSKTHSSFHHLSSGPITDLLIGFYGRSDASEIQLYFDANPEIYDIDEISIHQARFINFLEKLITSEIGFSIGKFNILLPEEYIRLNSYNRTDRPYDLSKCLHELVEEQALRTPDAIAVAMADVSMSYKELITQANRLANYLSEQGISKGQRVGIYEIRSLEMVIEILAILKVGAAYVPLDPDMPISRIEFQIRDAEVQLVLGRSTLNDKIALPGIRVVSVNEILNKLSTVEKFQCSVSSENAAYVIYTSGSTGQPKGVVIPHRGVVNRLLWMQDEYLLDKSDCVLQKTPYFFDVSVWEFFWPLIVGARLFMAEPGMHRDPRYIAKIIREHNITTAHFVPPMLDLFLADPEAATKSKLRRILCSGEVLQPETVNLFFKLYNPEKCNIELHNLYGPTEASIDVTSWRCTPQNGQGNIPIGRPIANTRIYLLDPNGNLMPEGMPGEIYIGGIQVGAGYLNRPELTLERFVSDPFSGGKMYRTGDLARYRKDGVIEFLGRIDHQIKLRGFRIELREIESVLLEHPKIKQAIVTTFERGRGDKHLVAYVVANEAKSELLQMEISKLLSQKLPDYMIPSAVNILSAFPLLPNGKINRSVLPTPEYLPSTVTKLPLTPKEKLLFSIWGEVLGHKNFGVNDSFFTIGGDSMLSIRMRTLLEKRGYVFEIMDLFHYPTIHLLAPKLRVSNKSENHYNVKPFSMLRDKDIAHLPEGVTDAYPVSAMQLGMLFQTEKNLESAVYRVVTSVHVASNYNEFALKHAVAMTFKRHPALRSSFDLTNYSEPLQLIHGDVKVILEEKENLSNLEEKEQNQMIHDWIENAKFHQFNIDTPPLVIFTIHRRGPDTFQLSVVEHHAILDGWSDIIMLEEILLRYRAKLSGEELLLTPIPSTYKNFIAEERRILKNDGTRKYWMSVLEGVEPTFLHRNKICSKSQCRIKHQGFEVILANDVIEKLQKLARSENLPLKSLLISAHLAVLRLVCNSEDIVTGVVFNGRLPEEGGDEVIGVFINTLPLRINTKDLSLLSIAKMIFEQESEAALHGRYPFSQMQQDMEEKFQLDSYVNYMDFHREWQKDNSRNISVLEAKGVAETNFPLAVNFLVDPVNNSLSLWLDCDISILDPELCKRLTGYYQRALSAVATSYGTAIENVKLLDPRELELISEWNKTEIFFNKWSTVHDLIEHQALLTPDNIAFEHRWEKISYQELNKRSNQLAHYLREKGIRKGCLVGVCLRRGYNLAIAILAILKSGAAYVPLDPTYPDDRLKFIASDAKLHCVITERVASTGLFETSLILIDDEEKQISERSTCEISSDTSGSDLAYVIYTSGSTGLPKGTVIRHSNVVNFFIGMNNRIKCNSKDVVLALTSISFDISVLELLWPLTHGAKVVIAGDHLINNLVKNDQVQISPLNFSLFFFGSASTDNERARDYQLVLDAARYADVHGFEAIWTPERHFHAFGGLYPNPSLLAAALSTITERIKLRCGSVVAPLHDSIRIAEEWSLVDNLSKGRIGLAFASGWNANDFVFYPERYNQRKQRMFEQIIEVKKLWSGESLTRINGKRDKIEVKIFPYPFQEKPPLWVTSAGSLETFEKAAEAGVNVLTHLLGQNLDELADKIKAYRRIWHDCGHPGTGKITIMVHTFLLNNAEKAKEEAREPFKNYLRTSTELLDMLAASMGLKLPESMTKDDLDSVLDLAVERYFEQSGLFGSPNSILSMVKQLSIMGANEIACLIDFGIPAEKVLNSLQALNDLKELYNYEIAETDHSFTDLIKRHKVTLIQSTPSFLSAVVGEPRALDALKSVHTLLVGGEAFPAGLARRLLNELLQVRLYNMYGPTETTIWSTVHELNSNIDTDIIPIGRPISNTEVMVLDASRKPVPIGVDGELWIGGAGVSGLYLDRTDLTAERFHSHPLKKGYIYRTGDRVRWRNDGLLEFRGRIDRQVKILGHRIELDEIESILSKHPKINSVAVIAASKNSNATELVAYISPNKSSGMLNCSF